MATRLEQQQCAAALNRATLDTDIAENDIKIIECCHFLTKSVVDKTGANLPMAFGMYFESIVDGLKGKK